MKVSGTVETIDRDERGVKLKLSSHSRQFWFPEVIRSKAKDLKVGDVVTVTANPGRFYEFVESIERGEASASNADSSPQQTEKGPEPPKTEIAVSEPQLPDTVEGLQQFILVTHEALKIYQTKLAAVNKLNVAQAIRNRTLEDGQKVGTALLWAEAKLGELLEGLANPTASRAGRRQLPEGITHKQSHFAQQLAGHKDLVEEAIHEAVENEDIPTRTQVLQKIKALEATPKPEPVPPEQWKDCGQFDCPVCKGTYRILHLTEGRHKLEAVEVIEK